MHDLLEYEVKEWSEMKKDIFMRHYLENMVSLFYDMILILCIGAIH